MLVPFLILIASVRASLYIGFPFSEQIPDVARVNEPYNFKMANVTFKSTTGQVIYTASNLPDWLNFDGDSRVFTGNPTEADVSDNVVITLNGRDSVDNSTISADYSLVVSSDPGLELSSKDVMFTQIAKYGDTNGDDGLVVKPGEDFNIKFDSSVFQMDPNSDRKIVAYYGRSADRSSLPNWIHFNADEMSFYGTVPYVTSDIAPSIDYGFSFIGSDYVGYAGAVGNFKLVVGAHQLSTSLNETIKINGTLKSEFDVSVPVLSAVYSDGILISRENISSVTANDLPSYATLNQDNYTLSGSFPDQSTFDNFTISVQDKYGNVVELPYSFDAIGSVFTVRSLPNVNATKGEFFDYQLLNSYFTDNSTNVTVDYSNADWLSFDDKNRTFLGMAPSNLGTVSVSVRAVSDYDDETKSFDIKGISAKDASSTSSTTSSSSTSTSSSSSSASSSTSATAATGTKKSGGLSNKTKLAIGLGVGIPCFLLLIAALFFCLCCFGRRRKNRDKKANDAALDDEKRMPPPTSPKINGPGFGTTISQDDHDEDARQLTALNVLKLDEKKDTSDTKSTSSSITQVESDYSSTNYFDASERPIKSWRAIDASDAAVAESNRAKLNRASAASASTVNTENLFSVRLVEDNNVRYSTQTYGSQFMSSNSLNGFLKRDDSGNIQRLDSDGNIVDQDLSPRETVKMSRSRSTSSNLEILLEENSKDYTNSTVYHSAGNVSNDNNTENSFNMLSKFNNSNNSSAANSDQHLHGKYYDSDNSLVDEFKAIHASNGEIQWSEANTDSQNSIILEDGHNDTIGSLEPSPMRDSTISLGTGAATRPSYEQRYSSSSLGNKAKLVDFTRKGSLKDAKHKVDHTYFQGETAYIHDDDSE
ncbi:axial budding pattern protein 2 [[Candida] anglica]|uniref:Axial budding pattern protein 2 n=1 Tax=[Candida] anglica TaxID=148631 RepID=A0ABP0EJL6_9ASCO